MKKLILLILLIINFCFAKDYFKNKFQFSRKEVKQAKLFLSILKKDNIKSNLQEIRYFSTLHKKNELFLPYARALKRLQKILKVKNFNHFVSLCNDYANQYSHDLFAKKTTRICLKKFFKYSRYFAKNPKSTYEFVDIYLNKLIHHSKYQNNIKIPLKALGDNRTEKIVQKSLDIYLNSKSVPNSFVFEDLTMSLALRNKYLNSFPYLDHENAIFRRELREIKKKIFASIKTKKSSETISSLVTEFINFYQQNKSYISPREISEIFFKVSNQLNRKKYYDLSSAVITSVKSKHFNKKEENFIFLELWNKICSRKYKEAFLLLSKFELHKNYESLEPKTKFWIAHILGKNKEKTLRSFYLKDIIQSHPLNFYAVAASVLEEKITVDDHIENLVSDTAVDIKTSKASFSLFKRTYPSLLKRIKLWDYIGSMKMVKYEVDSFLKQVKFLNKERPKKTQQISLNLVKFLSQTKNHLANFSLIYKIALNDEDHFNLRYLNFLFPTPFKESIKKYSKNINPLLVQSLMRQESAFNPRAISSAGARGLMQLMPQTAKSVQRFRRTKKLYTPEFNIKIGVKFLKKLISYYDGDLVFALAAYNAGKHRVNSWIKAGRLTGSSLEKIEKIPFHETRLYVKLIMRNLFFYKHLNKKSANYNILKNALTMRTP